MLGVAAVIATIGIGNPSIAGAAPDLVLTASWYGPGFQGQPMRSGERFNENDPTIAASFRFPLGTKLDLVNVATGDEATVIVKDRGPYVKGRQIDLSKAGATRLGYVDEGIAQLRVISVSLPSS
jgi:rare lipoprotein A